MDCAWALTWPCPHCHRAMAMIWCLWSATEQKACLLSSYTCSLLRGVFNVLLSMATADYLVEDMVQWSLICHIICHNTDFWSFFWRVWV